MINMDVSVIILTYNPHWDKLRRTLVSVIKQKGVNIQIVISDDGSSEDYRDQIEEVLKNNKVTNYVYNKNEKNVGTVKNYLSGLYKAKGRYTFAISPGDMLFDETSLYDMITYCDENQAKICFGNAVYYHSVGEGLEIYRDINQPNHPQFYGINSPLFICKMMFFANEDILGVSYLRETKCAIECFEAIKDIAIYLEDKCSSAVALMKGIKIIHFNRKFVWYENGTGISTSNNTAWLDKLEQDYWNVIKMLYEKYPKDRMLDVVISKKKSGKTQNKVVLLIKHPIYCISRILCKVIKKKYTECSEELKKQFQDIL